MKSLKFSRDSWHFKLAAFTGYHVWEGEQVDLCAYTRRVIGSILIILFLSAIALVIAYLAISMLLGIMFSIFYGMFIFSEPGILGLILTSSALFFVGLHFFVEWLRDHRDRKRYAPAKPDGFVKNAYKGFKNKYCAMVTFDGEDASS